jgi:hypothetical protein
MATSKKATKVAVLKFKPEWISDPPPPFFKDLDKAVIKEIAQAKKDFTARLKDILAKGQQR